MDLGDDRTGGVVQQVKTQALPGHIHKHGGFCAFNGDRAALNGYDGIQRIVVNDAIGDSGKLVAQLLGEALALFPLIAVMADQNTGVRRFVNCCFQPLQLLYKTDRVWNLLLFRALITALWLPFRQGKPLHGTKDPFLQIRIGGAELID